MSCYDDSGTAASSACTAISALARQAHGGVPCNLKGLPLVLRPGPPGSAGLSFYGSGCGYRDRDRRDSMSDPAMDTSLSSSGISSSPAR